MFDYFFDNNSYWFSRPLKDMYPYTYQVVDGKGRLILNTLGVSPEDIDISVNADPNGTQLLAIKGKTKKYDREYSVSMSFKVKDKVKNIDWETADGVTALFIEFEKPALPDVKINRK